MSNPPALRDYPWRIGYASDTHNPIVDFYIPALERASQYDRKAGFFNSAILSSVARGIGAGDWRDACPARQNSVDYGLSI